jgi:hypothetical protein
VAALNYLTLLMAVEPGRRGQSCGLWRVAASPGLDMERNQPVSQLQIQELVEHQRNPRKSHIVENPFYVRETVVLGLAAFEYDVMVVVKADTVGPIPM